MNVNRQNIDVSVLSETLRTKWPGLTLSEGFVPFPKKLLRCASTLFPGQDGVEELQVALAVVDYLRPNLSRDPSLEYLSFLSGIAEQRFDEILTRLEDRGLLSVSGDHDGYRIDVMGLASAIAHATATT